jgi:hypothetical protein
LSGDGMTQSQGIIAAIDLVLAHLEDDFFQEGRSIPPGVGVNPMAGPKAGRPPALPWCGVEPRRLRRGMALGMRGQDRWTEKGRARERGGSAANIPGDMVQSIERAEN